MNFMQILNFVVTEAFNGHRIDKTLSSLSNLSRVRIQALIAGANVKVDSIVILDQNFKLKQESNIEVSIPPPVASHIVAKQIDFSIVYEDDDLIVVNKPDGLTVHPGAGNQSDTLVNALVKHCGDNLSGIGGILRPGIVHRLDKDTSGLMLVAKNDLSHIDLSKQISERSAQRIYKAIVWGVPLKSRAVIENNIGRSPANRMQMKVLSCGKLSSTSYKVIEVLGGNKASIVECKLNTGRTHQIRVHMSHIGHSIIGDQTYGQNARKMQQNLSHEQQDNLLNFKRQALHSFSISFVHPKTKQVMQFESELPQDLKNLIAILTVEMKN